MISAQIGLVLYPWLDRSKMPAKTFRGTDIRVASLVWFRHTASGAGYFIRCLTAEYRDSTSMHTALVQRASCSYLTMDNMPSSTIIKALKENTDDLFSEQGCEDSNCASSLCNINWSQAKFKIGSAGPVPLIERTRILEGDKPKKGIFA